MAEPMQFVTDDEGDVCRVCRSEADEENPLIYPCKCSGSVRFVHPDCLKNWLAHSQKKHCEICGYHYKFTKVYPLSLPSVIPRIVFVRQSFFAVNYGLLRILRVIVVAWAWLVALPSFNMFSLRLLLLCADWVSYPYLKHSLEALHPDEETAVNATISAVFSNSSAPATVDQPASNSSIVDLVPAIASVLLRPFLVTLAPFSWLYDVVLSMEKHQSLSTILRGQILSLSLAAVLVGIILLREWMHQHDWNRPPPPAEEEEIRPEDWVIELGVAYPRGTEPNRQRLFPSPGPSPLSTAFPSTMPPPLPEPFGEPVHLNENGIDAPSNEAGPSMRLPLPPFDQNNPLHRPSPQTPNNDVAFSAPEMLATSSKGKEREVLFDNGESAADEHGDIFEVAEQSLPGPSGQRDFSSSPLLAQRRRSVRTPELTQEELGEQIPIGETIGEGIHEGLSDPFEVATETSVDANSSTSTLVVNQVQGHEAPSQDAARRRASDPGFNGLRRRYNMPIPEDVGSDDPMAALLDTLAVPTNENTEASSSASSAVDLGRTRSGLPLPDSDDRDAVGDIMEVEIVYGNEIDENGRHLARMVRYPVPAAMRNLPPPTDLPHTPSAAEWEMVEEDEEDHIPEMDGEDDDPVPEPVEEGVVVEEAFAGEVEGDPMDDEFRVWEAEDWDGVLEVIGLIGPLSSMFQNVFFAMIVMAGSLSLLIGAPAIIGKIVLAADFVRLALAFFTYILRSIRYVFEPVTDIIIEIIRDVVLAPLLSALDASGFLPSLSLEVPPSGTAMHSPVVSYVNDAGTAAVSGLGDVFEALGHTAFTLYTEFRVWAVEIASSAKTPDQVGCVIIGYISFGLIIAAFALAGETGVLQLSSTVVQTAKQYGTFVKLAFFMGLELICFPLAVGTFIATFTLPLFPDWSLESYAELFRAMPFGLVFVAWIVGTIFMFAFATGIAFIRTISRKGTLFFIRDPADDSFSPVKEILERTTFWQLRKLFSSIITYGVLIFFIFGVTSWTVSRIPFAHILPLRLKYESLSSVPFDVLFVHLIVPPTWRSLKPKHKMKKRFLRWYRWTVRAIGLRSLVLGEYQPAGDDNTPAEVAWSFADFVAQMIFGKYDPDLTFARVPSKDTVALLPVQERRKVGIFVRLDEFGVPKTEEDKVRLLKQDRAARAAGRDPKTDYQVVRLPRYWRTRAYALVLALVALTSTSVVVLFFGPLLIGRLAVTLFTDKQVYDGYSLMLGFYVCWGSYSLGRFTQRRVLVANKAKRIRQSNLSMRVKRAILGTLRCAYSAWLMYAVLPLTIGINFELYASIPARYGLDSTAAPVLHVWDAWAMGLVLLSLYFGVLGLFVHRGRNVSPRAARLKEAFRRPFTQPFVEINILVLPLVVYLLVPIILPWLVSVGLMFVLNLFGAASIHPTNALSFRLMFPLTSTAMIGLWSRRTLNKYLTRVRQRMIDAEYVLEERVENYEAVVNDGDPEWEDL